MLLYNESAIHFQSTDQGEHKCHKKTSTWAAWTIEENESKISRAFHEVFELFFFLLNGRRKGKKEKNYHAWCESGGVRQEIIGIWKWAIHSTGNFKY